MRLRIRFPPARNISVTMRITRRTFLTSAGTVPLAGMQTHIRGAIEPAVKSPFDPWIEVHAGHLRTNAQAVARQVRVPILAVIKNNGYGTGVVQVARALEPLAAIHGFAVVKAQEAHA